MKDYKLWNQNKQFLNNEKIRPNFQKLKEKLKTLLF